MDIEITFINQSNDENNSTVVIFQKNMAAGASPDELLSLVNQSNDANNSGVVIFEENMTASASSNETVVAWCVIKNCGKNWSHPFKYPINSYIQVQDPWGNTSDLKPALNGQKWDVILSKSGDTLSLDSSPASNPAVIEVKNCLAEGAINAGIYKDGKLLATKTGISPQQSAAFAFSTNLWVGVVSEMEEGQIINSAILSEINTFFSLLGLTKANLIMTGGGSGPTAEPFRFTLVPTGY